MIDAEHCGQEESCQGHMIDQNKGNLTPAAKNDWITISTGSSCKTDCPYNYFVRQQVIEDVVRDNHDMAVAFQLEQDGLRRDDAIKSVAG